MKLLRSITTPLVVLATLVGTSMLGGPGAVAATGAASSATSVSAPLDVTRDQFANNEESLGMSLCCLALPGCCCWTSQSTGWTPKEWCGSARS